MMNSEGANGLDDTVTGGEPNADSPATAEQAAETLRKLIEETDWEAMTKRLLVYARLRLSRYGVAGRRFTETPEDYVVEAVRLALEGRRRYPVGRSVSLLAFLCRVIDSLISHDFEKHRMRGGRW